MEIVRNNLPWIAKCVFKDLPLSRESIRSVAITAEVASDHGIKPFGLDLGVIAGLAQLFDKAIYLPETIKKGEDFFTKIGSLKEGIDAKKVYSIAISGIKASSDMLGSLGFLALMGVQILAPHSQWFSKCKKITKLLTVIPSFIEEGNEIYKVCVRDTNDANQAEQNKKIFKRRQDLASHSLKVIIIAFSILPSNYFGYVKAAYGEALKASKIEIPKWTWQAFSMAGSYTGLLKRFVDAAPAA